MKHLIYALACVTMLSQAPATAQTLDDQRKEELKAHIAAPKNFKEAGIYYGAADGYEIANSPKITADSSAYRVFGRIEISPNQNAFIARYYFDGVDSPDPRTRQITRESLRLFGRTKTPYFQVQIPSGLQKAYANNARMNALTNVVGTYVGNTEIVMTTNQRVQIPVFEALFLEFGEGGPIAFTPMPKQAMQAKALKETPAEPQGGKNLGAAIAQYKPSFDCSKAGTNVEKLICTNSRLGNLDGLLAATYKSRLSPEFGADPAIMRANQKSWMSSRNQCADASCIQTSYTARIQNLCAMPVTSGVHSASDCDTLGQD